MAMPDSAQRDVILEIIHKHKEKQSVPDGERPVVHIAIVCGFWQGASTRTHPVFVLYLIF